MKKFKIIIPLAALLILVLYGGWRIINLAQDSGQDIPRLYEVPQFAFTNFDGTTVSRDSLLGNITVVDFIFTNCPGICPMMTRRMSEFYEHYEEHPQVRFLSVSIDPARDSLAALEAYANDYGIYDSRWKFVRNDSTETQQLYEQGFKLGGDLPYGHSLKFVLVDRDGFIRGYYSSDDDISLSVLKTHINTLLRQSS